MIRQAAAGLGLSLLALKPLTYAAGALVLLVTLFYLAKAALAARRIRAQTGKAAPGGGAGAAADLTDESLLASELPEDDWLRLARELLERGEPRLAMRAFYLSTLALLAGRGLVRIARHKTNGDYLAEVRRRAAGDTLAATFARVVLGFERTWYGRDEASEATVGALLADRQRIADAATNAAAVSSTPLPPPLPASPPPPPLAVAGS